jgi:hypothetical protein
MYEGRPSALARLFGAALMSHIRTCDPANKLHADTYKPTVQ